MEFTKKKKVSLSKHLFTWLYTKARTIKLAHVSGRGYICPITLDKCWWHHPCLYVDGVGVPSVSVAVVTIDFKNQMLALWTNIDRLFPVFIFPVGHYISDVYDMKKHSWLTYNDLDVSRTQEAAVQRDRDRSGYIFFYMHKWVCKSSCQLVIDVTVMMWDALLITRCYLVISQGCVRAAIWDGEIWSRKHLRGRKECPAAPLSATSLDAHPHSTTADPVR